MAQAARNLNVDTPSPKNGRKERIAAITRAGTISNVVAAPLALAAVGGGAYLGMKKGIRLGAEWGRYGIPTPRVPSKWGLRQKVNRFFGWEAPMRQPKPPSSRAMTVRDKRAPVYEEARLPDYVIQPSGQKIRIADYPAGRYRPHGQDWLKWNQAFREAGPLVGANIGIVGGAMVGGLASNEFSRQLHQRAGRKTGILGKNEKLPWREKKAVPKGPDKWRTHEEMLATRARQRGLI